ncbi:hypothetical protein MD588_22275 [Photobacterium sp. SDRW27]|uniref:hypothetical protein n=1 Tax=Photobacterium obscurum TaxID=2829490 RepID=UPI002244536E|nr:hypothetical protein [Photobacterium obscurum]MCW8331527.1 hypothetical protein [Photobacterium obscurum]
MAKYLDLQTSSVTTVSSVDPELEKLFNQLLRSKLDSTLNISSQNELAVKLSASFKELTATIADTPNADHQCWVELFAGASEALLSIYQDLALTESERHTSYINATGQVMSVDDAVHTVKDIYRVKAFIRGLHLSIRQQIESNPSKTIHLVYPACGPFAPLLLPLLSYCSEQGITSDQLTITLIDIQPGAVKVLNRLVDDLAIRHYIQDILCIDVMGYQPELPIDILLMEAFQHGLSREGHVSFARHLSQFIAEGGVMLPEKVEINACLAKGQREYNDQWQQQPRCHSTLIDPSIQQERIELGNVFTLTLDKLRTMSVLPLGDGFEIVECEQVQIPSDVPDINQRILLTTASVNVFGDENIEQYDSGISHPRADMSICIDFIPKVPEPDDLLVRSGDHIKFYYKLCGTPGFLPTLA